MNPMLGAITDIDALVTWATTNSATILLVGVALLAFSVGRKLLKKGT